MCLMPPRPKVRASKRSSSNRHVQPEPDQPCFRPHAPPVSDNSTPFQSPDAVNARSWLPAGVGYRPYLSPSCVPQCSFQPHHMAHNFQSTCHIPQVMWEQQQPNQSLVCSPNVHKPSSNAVERKLSWKGEQETWKLIVDKLEKRERDEQARRDAELLRKNAEEIEQLKRHLEGQQREERERGKMRGLVESVLANRDIESRRSSGSRENQRSYVRESPRLEGDMKGDVNWYAHGGEDWHNRRGDRRSSESPPPRRQRRPSGEIRFETFRHLGTRNRRTDRDFGPDFERFSRVWERQETVRAYVS